MNDDEQENDEEQHKCNTNEQENDEEQHKCNNEQLPAAASGDRARPAPQLVITNCGGTLLDIIIYDHYYSILSL